MNPFKTLFLSLLIALSTGCTEPQKIAAEVKAPKSLTPPPEDDNSLVGSPPEWVVNPGKYTTPPAPQKDSNGKDNNNIMIPVLFGLAGAISFVGIDVIISKLKKGKNLDNIPKVKFTQADTHTMIEESLNRSLNMMTKYSDLKSENVSQNTVQEIVRAAKINGQKNAEIYERVDQKTLEKLLGEAFSKNKVIANYDKIMRDINATPTAKKQAAIESFNLSMLAFIENGASVLTTFNVSRNERLQAKSELSRTAIFIAQELDKAMRAKGIEIEMNHSWIYSLRGKI